MPLTRLDAMRRARLEAEAQADSLERERRRIGDRIYGADHYVASYPKRTQLTTMVAEAEALNFGFSKLKDCMVALESQMGTIASWAESMERRMERGEEYADEVEVIMMYSAQEMLRAMTDEVATLSRASEGKR